MGAIAAGGKAAGIYTTNASDAVQYIVEHSESKVAIVEDAEQLKKFTSNITSLPKLKVIVVYGKEVKEEKLSTGCEVLNWVSFMKRSSTVQENEVYKRIEATKPG